MRLYFTERTSEVIRKTDLKEALVCCAGMQAWVDDRVIYIPDAHFDIDDDADSLMVVSIELANQNGTTQIKFCPFCGDQIEFVQKPTKKGKK